MVVTTSRLKVNRLKDEICMQFLHSPVQYYQSSYRSRFELASLFFCAVKVCSMRIVRYWGRVQGIGSVSSTVCRWFCATVPSDDIVERKKTYQRSKVVIYIHAPFSQVLDTTVHRSAFCARAWWWVLQPYLLVSHPFLPGKGGNGSVSWYHEPFIRFPRPDGADGGSGGPVVIQADSRVSSLDSVSATVTGMNGGDAKGNRQLGRNGSDTIVPVPPGTVVHIEDEV